MENVELKDVTILAIAYKGLGVKALIEELETTYKTHKLPGLALAISKAQELETHCRALFTSKSLAYAAKHGVDLAHYEVVGFENRKGKLFLTFVQLEDEADAG